MKKILMYCHNGSGNHGCEAIVKSTTDLLTAYQVTDISLISSKKNEDVYYNLDDKINIYDELNSPKRYVFRFIFAYILQKVWGRYQLMNKLSYLYPYENTGKNAVSLSIGGDNYCYNDNDKYIGYHNISKSYMQKTVLWGCSIEPEVLNDKKTIEDLKSYDKIIARESLTYQALITCGLKNVKLYPDPAFTLETDDLFNILPINNTVGINVSPLILKYEKNNGIIIQNYINLIQYILENTNMNISLIPHVVWKDNDDREIIEILKSNFDSNRISVLDDCNCKQIKKHISKLRFLVAARTHASIAAYSTCIPTLVVGYSIKSKGIAKDLFGSYENYVISVDKLCDENELVTSFMWLLNNEDKIKNRLNTIMPEYVLKARESIKEIIELAR